jgi:CRP/FNR family transcriptional regulator
MLKVNHPLTYQLMKFYANEMQDAERRLRDLAHMDVKGRLADTLLQLKKQFGINKEGFIDIRLTRQDIASYAGTTYETIFRMMTELKKARIIKVSGKNIAIANEEKLQQLINP